MSAKRECRDDSAAPRIRGPSLATTRRMPAHTRTALLLALAASACLKIEDSSSHSADSAAAALGNLGRSDSAAPRSAGIPGDPLADSAMLIRGNPALATQALAQDTAASLITPDSSLAAQPSESDLAALRAALIVPVSGVAPSALHDTYAELRGGTRQHEALDILAPRGTPVVSAANGRVLKLFTSKPGGLMVYAADAGEHYILMYGHLDAYAPGLAEGQPLRQGQPIGVVGTTGNAPANVPHLHFAIARSIDVKQWWKGAPMDPYPLLAPLPRP